MLLTVSAASSLVLAQSPRSDTDLQALYQQIDDAIEQSPQYVAKRLSEIGDTRSKFDAENSLEKQFALAEQLYALYKPYRNDSALYYADLCVLLADSLNRQDMAGLYLSQKARQCSNAGMYVESLNLLRKVDKHSLSREGLTKYYWAWMHVCGEIGSYSQLPEVRRNYFALQDSYRDSVLAVAEEGSEEFMHLKMDVLSARRLYQDALALSDSWISNVTDGTHENAFAAFYRSMVYDKLGNGLQVRYWLGKSALDDVKCAVYDQASLFMLAERLCEDGDYDRAYRYLRFTEVCNRAYTPRLRNYQVGFVATVMDAVYQNSQARYSRLLTIACVAALLFLGAFVWLLLRRRHRV